MPRLAYVGESLPSDLDSDAVGDALALALPHATVDAPVAASVLPMLSTGHAGPPALRAHRAGRDFGHRFHLNRVVERDHSLTVELSDPSVALAASIQITLDPQSGVIGWSTTLRNTGDAALTVDWLAAASLELPTAFTRVEHFGGRWGQELQNRHAAFDDLPLALESWRGRTGHQSYPGVVVGEAGYGNRAGRVWIAHMAWSGNHRVSLQRDDNGVPVLQHGVAFHPGECILESGESLETPTVFFAVGDGRDAARQQLHEYARNHWLPPWTRSTRPVHCNSWEALYFNHDINTLNSLVDAAADAGAERFVLDDGWFHARRDDSVGLGDWWVDRDIYPDGLAPVVDHVRARGLQFGLWFEPEMVSPDSELMRTHPEWVLGLDGVDTPLARQQLALDVSREDVQNYLFDAIAKLVETHEIDYIKWDMNRDLVLPGDGCRAVAARQPRAVRTLMQRLCARFPQLEIESCASGGGRLDWGLLDVCGRVWLSDNLDPIDRMRMQIAATTFLPSEVLGSHVGHQRAHLTGRQTPLTTRAIVALGGQYGFETDLRGLDEAEHETLSHYTALYKASRAWLAEARHWSVDGLPPGMLAEGRVSADAGQALYSVLASAATPNAPAGTLCLPGLLPEQRYRVRLCNASLDELAPHNRVFPRWCHDGVVLNGALLERCGLQLPIMPAQSAVLVSCEKVH